MARQTDQRGQRFPLPNTHTLEARKEEAERVRLETEARRSGSEGRSLIKLPAAPGLRRTSDPSSSGSHQTHTTFLAYISQVEKSLLIPYVGALGRSTLPSGL